MIVVIHMLIALTLVEVMVAHANMGIVEMGLFVKVSSFCIFCKPGPFCNIC